jgi:hypothetical protein
LVNLPNKEGLMKRKLAAGAILTAAFQSPASAFGPPADTGWRSLNWCYTDKAHGNQNTNWMTYHFSFPCFDWL